MGDSIPGAAVGGQRMRFGKKQSGKPRRMILPEGVTLVPVGGRFELHVEGAASGTFDSPSEAIDHLVRTSKIVPEQVRESPKPEHDHEYVPGPDGGTNLYRNGEFEGYFPDLNSAKAYVRELAKESRREALRKAGNYWD